MDEATAPTSDLPNLVSGFYSAREQSPWTVEQLTNRDGRSRPRAFQRLVSALKERWDEDALAVSLAERSPADTSLLLDALEVIFGEKLVSPIKCKLGIAGGVEPVQELNSHGPVATMPEGTVDAPSPANQVPLGSSPANVPDRITSASPQKARQSRWQVPYSERQRLVALMEQDREQQKQRKKQAWMVTVNDVESLIASLLADQRNSRLSSLDLELMRLNQQIMETSHGLLKMTAEPAPAPESKKTRIDPPAGSQNLLVIDFDPFWHDFRQCRHENSSLGSLIRHLERTIEQLAASKFFAQHLAPFDESSKSIQPCMLYYSDEDDGIDLSGYDFEKDQLGVAARDQAKVAEKCYKLRAYRYRRMVDEFSRLSRMSDVRLPLSDLQLLSSRSNILNDWYESFRSIRRLQSSHGYIVCAMSGDLGLSRLLAALLVLDVPVTSAVNAWNWKKYGVPWAFKELRAHTGVSNDRITILTSHRTSSIIRAVAEGQCEFNYSWFNLLPFLRSIESKRHKAQAQPAQEQRRDRGQDRY